jgi:hypothetical protein
MIAEAPLKEPEIKERGMTNPGITLSFTDTKLRSPAFNFLKTSFATLARSPGVVIHPSTGEETF